MSVKPLKQSVEEEKKKKFLVTDKKRKRVISQSFAATNLSMEIKGLITDNVDD